MNLLHQPAQTIVGYYAFQSSLPRCVSRDELIQLIEENRIKFTEVKAKTQDVYAANYTSTLHQLNKALPSLPPHELHRFCYVVEQLFPERN